MNSLLLKSFLGFLVASAAVHNHICIMEGDELTGLVDGSAMPHDDYRDRVETTSVIAAAKLIDTRLFFRRRRA